MRRTGRASRSSSKKKAPQKAKARVTARRKATKSKSKPAARPARRPNTPPPPVLDKRTLHALELFQKASKALNRKDFSRARDLLDELIEKHPEERDVLERARAYRALCERALERVARPKTFEDLLHYGIYHHNRGEYQEALKYLNQAAEIHPRNEHVLYCVAASAARTGDNATALKALRSAITASPANRAQAKSDLDFESLREHPDFLALLD
jgi:tetratricopeptide (TPR) repeat protein